MSARNVDPFLAYHPSRCDSIALPAIMFGALDQVGLASIALSGIPSVICNYFFRQLELLFLSFQCWGLLHMECALQCPPYHDQC